MISLLLSFCGEFLRRGSRALNVPALLALGSFEPSGLAVREQKDIRSEHPATKKSLPFSLPAVAKTRSLFAMSIRTSSDLGKRQKLRLRRR